MSNPQGFISFPVLHFIPLYYASINKWKNAFPERSMEFAYAHLTTDYSSTFKVGQKYIMLELCNKRIMSQILDL